MKIIDLSVSIVDGLPVDRPVQIPKIRYRRHTDDESVTTFLAAYPGLTREQLIDGHGWAIEQIELSTHTGTHVDAPYHFHPTMNGGEPAWTVDEVPLEWCMGDGVMVDFYDKPDGYQCTSKDFQEYFDKIGYTPKYGDVLCLRTNAMSAWGTEKYLQKGCGVGREATLWLIDHGVRDVGTDGWSWDVPLPLEGKEFAKNHDASIIWEAHRVGREKAYCHIEKLANLDKLPLTGYTVICLPVKVKGGSAGWTRVVAVMHENGEKVI